MTVEILQKKKKKGRYLAPELNMHINMGFMNQGRWFLCPECPMVLSRDPTISFTCDLNPHFQRRRITTLLSPNPKKKGLVFFVAANILEGANTLAGLRNERAKGFEANSRAAAARTMPQECRPRKALPGSASRAWQEEKERKKRKENGGMFGRSFR